MLAFFAGALEFPVGFLKLCNFFGQLCISTIVIARRISGMWCIVVVWSALRTFPCKGLFWSTVLLIHMTLHSIMDRVCTPMLPVQDAVLCINAVLLCDAFAECDHLFLGGTSSLHTSLGPFAFLLSQEGLFDVLQHF